MVSKCPPKLCHGQRNRETKVARLGSYSRLKACIILDKKLFNYYKVFVNGEHYYLGQKSLNFDIYYDVQKSTPIHFEIYLDFKNIETKDYKTYFVVVQFENVDDVIFTLDLIGVGDKCPKDWCESDDKTCLHTDGPIQDYKLAQQTCTEYNGDLSQNLEIMRTQMCLREKLPLLNTTMLVTVNAEDVCSVLDIYNTTRDAKLKCEEMRNISDYYFVCQIPFWAQWPPDKNTPESTTITAAVETTQSVVDAQNDESLVALDVTTLIVIIVTLLIGGLLVGVTYFIIHKVRGTNRVNEITNTATEHHYDILQQPGMENPYLGMTTVSADHQTTDLKALYNM